MNKCKAFFEENKTKIGNISLLAAIFILTFGCWNEISWYDVMAPLGTLISFVFLLVTFACYANVRLLYKDVFFYMMLAGDIAALVNIFIIGSGIGAFFTAADLLMVLYLADKIVLPKKILYAAGMYIAFFFYYWTFDIKGYFKGYNTNYGGLVLITGFAFAIMMLLILREYLLGREKKRWALLLSLFIAFMFAWGLNIISWYRARCALIGLIMIALIMLIPRKIWKLRWIYSLLVFFSTLGAIIISIVYVFLGAIKDSINIQIFYKDILSGRDEIWSELWLAFFKHPLTGIGSNYVMKLEWMDGMFEVHNGLLDILIVHGLIVFALCCIMLIVRLWKVRESVTSSLVGKSALAGLMAMLVSSFMENFFIVPPFTLCFLMLFVFINSLGKTGILEVNG